MPISEKELKQMERWGDRMRNETFVFRNIRSGEYIDTLLAEVKRLREELHKEKTKRTCWDDPD